MLKWQPGEFQVFMFFDRKSSSLFTRKIKSKINLRTGKKKHKKIIKIITKIKK